jgi:hypothetical protein
MFILYTVYTSSSGGNAVGPYKDHLFSHLIYMPLGLKI